MLLTRSIRARQLGDSYIEISKYVRFQLRQRHLGSGNATKASVLSVRQSSTTSAQDHEWQLDKRPGHLTQDVGTSASSGKPGLAGKDHACLRRFQGSCLSQHEMTTWDSLAKTEVPTHSSDTTNEPNLVRICGYITSQRSAGKFEFLQLVDPGLELAVQVICSKQKLEQNVQSDADHGRRDTPVEHFNLAKDIRGHTPVQVVGSVVHRAAPPKKKGQTRSSQQLEVQNGNTLEKLDPFVGQINLFSHIEIQADAIIPLNTFPTDLVAKCDTVFPPELRHLQFRTDNELRSRIRLRSKVAAKVREGMLDKDFDEIETPLLFKSTPEGAREFIVPTRKKGMAYALPQSPQQYKQVLMASGVPRYFQFAKCFRDEDLRADRQPEFTQLDLEMSFVGAEQVMSVVEDIVRNFVWPSVPIISPLNPAFIAGESPTDMSDNSTSSASPFPRFSYNSVMARYGSDKPDTRLGSEIHRIEEWLPPNVKGMLTSLDDPIVEMIKIDMHGTDPSTSSQFIGSFLDAPTSSVYTENPAGMPGVSVYDAGKPLRGLASFGHEAAYKVEEDFEPEPGDIFIVQTRANAPFTGGSTILGNLRRDVLHSAISQGLIAAPSGFAALWVTDFPLFSPIEESEPGQGGMAGICSTHHPFTAPKQGQDLSLLMTDPLKVTGDHYDLVINGVEVGGGSRRIHIAEMQELILHHVLKLTPERLEDFRHLLNALKCGCPPHAGFALGFDRLMAMLTDRASVRDVIAFPKYADGEDKFVKSPSLMTADQLATYHLAITGEEVANPPPPVSRRA